MKNKLNLSKIPIRFILLGGISLLFIVFVYLLSLSLNFYSYNKQLIKIYKYFNLIDNEISIIDNKIDYIFTNPYRYITSEEYSEIYSSLNDLDKNIAELGKLKLVKNNPYFKDLRQNFEIYKNKLYQIQQLNNKLFNPTESRLAIIDNLTFQLKSNPAFNKTPFEKYTLQVIDIVDKIHTKTITNQNVVRKINKIIEQLDKMAVSSIKDKTTKNNLLSLLNTIKQSIGEYYFLLEQYGEPFSSGLLKEVKPYKLQASIHNLMTNEEEIIHKDIKSKQLYIAFVIFLLFSLLVFYGLNVYNIVYKNINKILNYIKSIEYGVLNKIELIYTSIELFKITTSINRIISNLTYKNNVLKSLSKGKFDVDIKPLSTEDELAYTIIKLKQYLEEYEKNVKNTIESEQRQKWITEALSHLSDILREHSSNLDSLLEITLKELLKTIDAPMGAIYYRKEENGEAVYILKIAYAYDKKKMPSVKYHLTEGFVGTAAADGKTIIISPVPDNYIFYETAFGHGKPKTIAWFPIKFKEEIFGILEIASNEVLEKHHITFTEKLCSDLATTIHYLLINEETKKLVKKLTEKTKEFEVREDTYKTEIEKYKEEIESLKQQIKQLKIDLNIKQNIISEKVAKNIELEQKLKDKDKELQEIIERLKKAEKAYETKIANLEDQIQKLIDKYEK